MKPVVLGTFKSPLTIRLNGMQRDQALRLLNLHYLQDEECNMYSFEEKKLIAKYPQFELDNPQFKESHLAAMATYVVDLKVELLSNGTLRIKK
jgi:hypothetical protein